MMSLTIGLPLVPGSRWEIFALALSTLLLVLTYLINLALTWIQQRGRKADWSRSVAWRQGDTSSARSQA